MNAMLPFQRFNNELLSFHVFPELVELTSEEHSRIIDIGRIAASVLKKANSLLLAAIISSNSKDSWLVKIMFGSIPSAYHAFAKELMIAVGDSYPVRLFRADVLGNGQIAELQCPGSGWPYNLALEEHYGTAPINTSIVRTYQHWAKGRKISWWLHNPHPMHERAVRHIEEVCRATGIDLSVFAENEFNPEAVCAVIKRPPLPELISSEKGRRLLQRWLDGKVEMDLLPSMVPETKHFMALLWHQETRHHFTDEERTLCPPTYFIDSPDSLVQFGNGSSKSIYEIFNHRRRGIVKYGGAVKDLRCGCHGVFNLGAQSMKLAKRLELMKRALDDYDRGEAWILQEFIDIQRLVPGFRRPQCVLFRPHYYITGNGQVEVMPIVINTRADWKVHAQTDAHLGLCC